MEAVAPALFPGKEVGPVIVSLCLKAGKFSRPVKQIAK